ncbi:hypothetical protein FGG78_31130 [Thioclava sp. BHET1]|nr:hypothetical protein FGG78_31130 [Thioclava sp. BHET1]
MSTSATPSRMEIPRGAAPVGYLEEVCQLEQQAILSLRSWFSGGTERLQLLNALAGAAPAGQAREIAFTFEALMQLLNTAARRPLMRHGLDCRCFGGDEAAFAQLVLAAAGRDREEALLFATLLLSGSAGYEAVQLTEKLAPILLAMSRGESAPPPVERQARLH